ncbi:MAG: hypothetical protein KAJ03_04665 [Gammaproteobacteria bacterium]|nr:hypothetical protein [Gammaproteobacteria bacterium]
MKQLHIKLREQYIMSRIKGEMTVEEIHGIDNNYTVGGIRQMLRRMAIAGLLKRRNIRAGSGHLAYAYSVA